MSIRVVARFDAKPGKREELKQMLAGLVPPTRQESGCIAYELLQNSENPDDFTFVEEWESKAHLDKHLKTPHLTAAIARFEELNEGAPFVGIYNLVA
jgi:quinol monooxygenase YgiN